MPGLIYFSTKDGAVATTLEEWRGWGRKEGGEERRKRVALAPRARWISIMLNRKWSPAIECLSAPPLEAHKAGGIRLLRCNVTEKLNSLVLSATAFSRPIVRFLPFPSLPPPPLPFVPCCRRSVSHHHTFRGHLERKQPFLVSLETDAFLSFLWKGGDPAK